MRALRVLMVVGLCLAAPVAAAEGRPAEGPWWGGVVEWVQSVLGLDFSQGDIGVGLEPGGLAENQRDGGAEIEPSGIAENEADAGGQLEPGG